MGSRGIVLASLIVLVGALPLLAAQPAPLQDWPNHLARIHILTGLLNGTPFWERFYRFTGFLVPNATMDVALLALTRAGLGMAAAATLFLLVVYAIFVAGFAALARACGGYGPIKPVFAVLLFYEVALFWGLVNYVLGVGLLLGLLAAYVASGRAWVRLCLAGGGAVVLLFTHAVSAVVWIAVLGCFDLIRFLGARAPQGRGARAPLGRRVLDNAGWVVALLVVGGLLHVMPGDTGHSLAAGYTGDGPADAVARKLLLFAKVLLGGSTLQDAASLLALLACVAAVLAGRPRLAAAPALATLVLIGTTMAAPEHVGTGSLLDQRLSVLPWILGAAAVRLRMSPRALGLAFAAVLLRTTVLVWQFHAAGLVFADFRTRTGLLPPGSVMLMAYGTPLSTLSWHTIWSPPLTSLATSVVFQGIFMPHIFANPAQQPLALRGSFQDLTQPWSLTDAAHLHATAAALAPLCAAHSFAGVYLTVLYPGAFIPDHAGAALLMARPDFLVLDACRLPHHA